MQPMTEGLKSKIKRPSDCCNMASGAVYRGGCRRRARRRGALIIPLVTVRASIPGGTCSKPHQRSHSTVEEMQFTHIKSNRSTPSRRTEPMPYCPHIPAGGAAEALLEVEEDEVELELEELVEETDTVPPI